jgi:hypothetical protein
MTASINAAIESEILSLKKRLSALRMAQQALGGSFYKPSALRKNKRRKLTPAEKANISRRMKAAWKKRKAAKNAV